MFLTCQWRFSIQLGTWQRRVQNTWPLPTAFMHNKPSYWPYTELINAKQILTKPLLSGGGGGAGKHFEFTSIPKKHAAKKRTLKRLFNTFMSKGWTEALPHLFVTETTTSRKGNADFFSLGLLCLQQIRNKSGWSGIVRPRDPKLHLLRSQLRDKPNQGSHCARGRLPHPPPPTTGDLRRPLRSPAPTPLRPPRGRRHAPPQRLGRKTPGQAAGRLPSRAAPAGPVTGRPRC